MMLTWCAPAALKEIFQTFPDLLIRRYNWDDDRNSCKSTCCSCRMPFHMHSLMSLDGLLRCQLQQPILSVPVLACKTFSSNGYQLQILVFLAMCLPQQPSRCIALAEYGHFSGRSKQIHFFSRWMFISDRDGIINLHQVPTSQQAAGFTLVFLQCLETSLSTPSSVWLKLDYTFAVQCLP